MTRNPSAERRKNVSHGPEPVERVIRGEFQPHRGGTTAASCVVPPGLGPLQFSVHGLTPVASVVSPLRGWFRVNRISSSGCFSTIRSSELGKESRGRTNGPPPVWTTGLRNDVSVNIVLGLDLRELGAARGRGGKIVLVSGVFGDPRVESRTRYREAGRGARHS